MCVCAVLLRRCCINIGIVSCVHRVNERTNDEIAVILYSHLVVDVCLRAAAVLDRFFLSINNYYYSNLFDLYSLFVRIEYVRLR